MRMYKFCLFIYLFILQFIYVILVLIRKVEENISFVFVPYFLADYWFGSIQEFLFLKY